MDNVTARVVGIYESEAAARKAADAARAAGAPENEIRVGESLDRLASVQSEMRMETQHTVAGPGNVGPFTKEMQKGMTVGVIVAAGVGLVLALPFAFIQFADWSFLTRLWVVALTGAVVGGTAGWVIGGGFGANRPSESLAAERGVSVSAPGTQAVADALMQPQLIRLDLVDEAGIPVRTLATEPPPPIAKQLGKHMAQEDRES